MKDDSPAAETAKFQNPHRTADGQPRARVALQDPQTLWFNTGTLCNIACATCYILSSPTNDALVYLTTAEVADYLDQIDDRRWPVRQIGFTGGEPFLNPDMIDMAAIALDRGFEVLILTNAMAPMMRPRVRSGLAQLIAAYGPRLTLRVSLDDFARDAHDAERGAGSFERTLRGMRWLRDTGARMHVAGRMRCRDSEAEARAGFARLYAAEGFEIDAQDPGATLLFPEMDPDIDVPEITTACWDLLGKRPADMMCASSRMVVRRKGADRAAVVACTLLPYQPEFELGATLAEAERDVALNHPHCAQFCVLGGASCAS